MHFALTYQRLANFNLTLNERHKDYRIHETKKTKNDFYFHLSFSFAKFIIKVSNCSPHASNEQGSVLNSHFTKDVIYNLLKESHVVKIRLFHLCFYKRWKTILWSFNHRLLEDDFTTFYRRKKNSGIEITNSVNLATKDQTRFFLTSKKAIFSQKCFYALQVKIFHFLKIILFGIWRYF